MNMSTPSPGPAPWFTAKKPWNWSFAHGVKSTVGVGNPQHLLSGAATQIGFQASASVGFNGRNASGLTGGSFPPNVGSVLNLSAAAIASAPAFNKHLNNDQS